MEELKCSKCKKVLNKVIIKEIIGTSENEDSVLYACSRQDCKRHLARVIYKWIGGE